MPSVETTLIVNFIGFLNILKAAGQKATASFSRTRASFQPVHRSIEITVSAINALTDRGRARSKIEEQQVLVLFA